jgi:hypothetical protein
MVPLGGPGVWVQLGALAVFGWWTGYSELGVVSLVILFLLAASAELIAVSLRRGEIDAPSRRRIGIGGLAGGGLGALLGLKFPLFGSLLGALAGGFAGTLASSLGMRVQGLPRIDRAGQVLAMSVSTAAGIVIAMFTLFVLIR